MARLTPQQQQAFNRWLQSPTVPWVDGRLLLMQAAYAQGAQDERLRYVMPAPPKPPPLPMGPAREQPLALPFGACCRGGPKRWDQCADCMCRMRAGTGVAE